MSWAAWWCGWASCAALAALLDRRWGWAAASIVAAGYEAWTAHRDHAKTTVDMDAHSAAIAAGFLHIERDEVATVEVRTRTGEQARFSVWRNT